jgi:hypothetical protein
MGKNHEWKTLYAVLFFLYLNSVNNFEIQRKQQPLLQPCCWFKYYLFNIDIIN